MLIQDIREQDLDAQITPVSALRPLYYILKRKIQPAQANLYRSCYGRGPVKTGSILP